MGPKTKDHCLQKRETRRGAGDVKMEAEVAVMGPQARECQAAQWQDGPENTGFQTSSLQNSQRINSPVF